MLKVLGGSLPNKLGAFGELGILSGVLQTKRKTKGLLGIPPGLICFYARRIFGRAWVFGQVSKLLVALGGNPLRSPPFSRATLVLVGYHGSCCQVGKLLTTRGL